MIFNTEYWKFKIESGIALADIAEGSIVKLNESGSPVEFYVMKHDYESGLNGTGRTLLVRKEGHSTRVWHSSGKNAYASSGIDTWLNGTYKNSLDSSARTAIGTTTFYYTAGNGTNTVSTLSRSVFLLSAMETWGFVTYGQNKEGTQLSNSSLLFPFNVGSSKNVQFWTRSPYTADKVTVFCTASGGLPTALPYETWGVRPCFTLPSTASFNPETMEFIK